MSSILLPRRRQIHQPQGLFELDPGNSFGVVAIAVPGLSATLGGNAVHVNNSNVTEGVGAGGVQYVMPAAKSAARFGSLDEFKPQPPFSVMFGFEPFSDSATGGFAMSNESATNYAGWDFIAAGTASGFRITLRLGNNGGTGSSNRADFLHTTRISLAPHVAGAVVRGVADADVVLDDDWQTPTRVGTASAVVYAANEPAFGTRAATAMVAGAYEFLLVADRALSQDEWRELRDNPYQVVKSRTRRLFFSLPAAPGGDVTGTISAAESGTDVCTAVGVVRVSGAIASAESAPDAASAAGEVLVSGALAAAEVGADHASLSGAIMVSGALSGVEQSADQAALVGSVLISGSVAALEASGDAASMSGHVLVSGTVSASESAIDTASLAGVVEVSGVLAAIESGQDTTVITGGDVVSPIVGIVTAVESGADVTALAGTVLVAGVAAASESESDQAGISGAVHVSGSVSAAEGQLDTAHVMGRVLVSGVIASTEAANDSASINGSSTTITSGVIAAAEAGADAAFIPGAVFVSGNAAAFEQGADIVVAAGVVRITGAIAANEVGTDTATILSLPRDMTPRAGYIAGAALQRTYIAGAALQRRYVA